MDGRAWAEVGAFTLALLATLLDGLGRAGGADVPFLEAVDGVFDVLGGAACGFKGGCQSVIFEPVVELDKSVVVAAVGVASQYPGDSVFHGAGGWDVGDGW